MQIPIKKSPKMLFGDETSVICDAILPYSVVPVSATEIGWIDLKHHSSMKYIHVVFAGTGHQAFMDRKLDGPISLQLFHDSSRKIRKKSKCI